MKVPVALSIAGFDPCGGAGILADIKTFSFFKVYGMGVVTALTSQNTFEFNGVFEVEKRFFLKQIDTVLKDILPDSVKIGMVNNTKIVDMIIKMIKKYSLKNIVFDPVMLSKTGGRLGLKDDIDFLIEKIFPLIDVLTPNIEEASLISKIDIKDENDIKKALKIIHSYGCKNVLIKGGHLNGVWCVDFLYDGKDFFKFKKRRLNTKNTHGTGCTLSSAIAANLALKRSIYDSVKTSVDYINKAIKDSFDIGEGNGPLNHFLK